MREALGGFVLAAAIGVYVGSSYQRARRSRRDYRTGVKAMKVYRNVMRKEQRRAMLIVGAFVLAMAAVFVSAARLGQQ